MARWTLAILALASAPAAALQSPSPDPLDFTPPGDIVDLVAVAGDESITVTWTNTGDDGDSGNSVLLDFWISTIGPLDNLNWDVIGTDLPGEPLPSPSGTQQSWTITGLTSGQTYWLTLWPADDNVNWGMPSNPVSAVPLDGTAPATVTDLAVAVVGDVAATLTWTSPGDDGSGGSAAAFELRCSTSPIDDATWASAEVVASGAPAAAGATHTVSVQGLAKNTLYYFAVRASDEAGNWNGTSNSIAQATDAGGSRSAGGCSAGAGAPGLALLLALALAAWRR